MIVRRHFAVLLSIWISLVKAEDSLTCSLTEQQKDGEIDPALHEMMYDVGDGPQTTTVYIEPDIASFYNGDPPASTKVTPKFKGFSGKFINLSNKPATLFWEERAGGSKHVMRHQNPFTASGTATFPGHRFIFAPVEEPTNHLQTFVIGNYPDNIYVYDPFLVEGDTAKTEENLKVLKKTEREQYNSWRKTLLFHEQYLNFTGRSYLANYLRDSPSHFMWRADYFGQEHWVTTRETHFVAPPPNEDLDAILKRGSKRVLKEDDFRLLPEYREPEKNFMNMTLKVLSVAPRVFEIKDFLSETEINHILQVAGGENLQLSSTGDVMKGEKQVKEDSRRTRTSFNSWVPRDRSPIFDAIYRRAADLMRIDEALLRDRSHDEIPALKSKRKISEDLQLVHYEGGQEYTAHHDFGFSRIDDRFQGARFATILFYLNEGMKGGETSFPRYVNAETFKALEVKPELGKAVLFYSQLPDGNLDDFSQHAANPVTDGEKWLINLWTWEPTYE